MPKRVKVCLKKILGERRINLYLTFVNSSLRRVRKAKSKASLRNLVNTPFSIYRPNSLAEVQEFAQSNRAYLKLYFTWLLSRKDLDAIKKEPKDSEGKKYIQYSFVNGNLPNPSIVGLNSGMFQHILFTTDENRQATYPWKTQKLSEIVPIIMLPAGARHVARFAKMQPCLLFPGEKYVIWRDSKVILDDEFLMKLLSKFIESGDDVGLVPHPMRTNVFEEIEALRYSNKIDRSSLERIEGMLQDREFKQNDTLYETSLMFLNLESERTREFLSDWFIWVSEVAIRDQLSVNLCLEENDVSVFKLFTTSQSLRTSGKSLVLSSLFDPSASGLETELYTRSSVVMKPKEVQSFEIIVPVYNSGFLVEQLLNSVIELDIPMDTSVRVILCDDGSSSNTVDVLNRFSKRFDWIQIITNERNLGFTLNVNKALANSTSDIVVILNSDTIIPKTFITKIKNIFKNETDKLVLGPLSNNAGSQTYTNIQNKKDRSRYLPFGFDVNGFDYFISQLFPSNYIIDIEEVHGFCLITRNSSFKEIGLFDQQLFPRGNGEETDWCFRAKKLGYKLSILPSLFVFHHGRGSFENLEKEKLRVQGKEALELRYSKKELLDHVNSLKINTKLNAAKNLINLRLASEVPEVY